MGSKANNEQQYLRNEPKFKVFEIECISQIFKVKNMFQSQLLFAAIWKSNRVNASRAKLFL